MTEIDDIRAAIDAIRETLTDRGEGLSDDVFLKEHGLRLKHIERLLPLAERALEKLEGKSRPHCPRCKSKEWFPGAACWYCGWEADGVDGQVKQARRAAIEDMKPYLRHRYDGDVDCKSLEHSDEPCTCGLDDLLNKETDQ